MIITIGSQLGKFTDYLRLNSTLTSLFTGGIYAGKPVEEVTGLTLFFFIPDDITETNSSTTGGITLRRKGKFSFVIIGNDKTITNKKLSEYLDVLTNEITGKFISLDTFLIRAINYIGNGPMLVDKKENPLIIGDYEVIYQPSY